LTIRADRDRVSSGSIAFVS